MIQRKQAIILLLLLTVCIVVKADFSSIGKIITFLISFVSKNRYILLVIIGIIGSYFIVKGIYFFTNIISDVKFVKTVDSLLLWLNSSDEASRKQVIEGYLSNTTKNICYGVLFDKEIPKKLFLAFSNENKDSDRIGKLFHDFNSEPPKIYCQYTYEELRKKVPLGLPNSDGKPFYVKKLTDPRHISHQSCAERKIIAGLLNEKECNEAFNKDAKKMILFTRLEPCAYCKPMIEEFNQKNAGKINIEYFYYDMLKVLFEDKELLVEIKKENEENLKKYSILYKLCIKPTKSEDLNKIKNEKDKQKQIKEKEKAIDIIAIRFLKLCVSEASDEKKIKEALLQLFKDIKNMPGISEEQWNDKYKKIVRAIIKKR